MFSRNLFLCLHLPKGSPPTTKGSVGRRELFQGLSVSQDRLWIFLPPLLLGTPGEGENSKALDPQCHSLIEGFT